MVAWKRIKQIEGGELRFYVSWPRTLVMEGTSRAAWRHDVEEMLFCQLEKELILSNISRVC
jgi:hypothetical protein